MKDRIQFILKIFILSLGLSVLIKYGGQAVTIAPSPLDAAIGVALPTLVMALALWWRGSQ